MTEAGSAKPEPIYETKTRRNKDNGEPEEYQALVGYESGVYRYTEGPTIILVKWLGYVGDVASKDEVRFLDLAYEADPFEGLGMEALMFEDEDAVDARAAEVRAMNLNDTNPMLAMLVNTLGLTTWDADIDEHMDLMEQAMTYCVTKAKEVLHTLRVELKELFTFVELEAIGKALTGVDLRRSSRFPSTGRRSCTRPTGCG